MTDKRTIVSGSGRIEVTFDVDDGSTYAYSWEGPVDTISQTRKPVETYDEHLSLKFVPGPFLDVTLRFPADKVIHQGAQV